MGSKKSHTAPCTSGEQFLGVTQERAGKQREINNQVISTSVSVVSHTNRMVFLVVTQNFVGCHNLLELFLAHRLPFWNGEPIRVCIQVE